MSHFITCSTKILTLAIAPFICDVLCEFAKATGVDVVPVSPQEEVMHSSS